MDLPRLNLRPNERYLEDKPGAVWHRAGDTKRRARALAAERAAREAERNDPDKIAERETKYEKRQRGDLEGRRNDAAAALKGLSDHELSLRAQREHALSVAAGRRDAGDSHDDLVEAARLAKVLSQMPEAIAKAQAAVDEATAALARFDAGAAARAEARVAERAAAEADAERRKRAQAAADAAFAAAMAADVEPAPKPARKR